MFIHAGQRWLYLSALWELFSTVVWKSKATSTRRRYTGLENREQRTGALLITIYPGGQCSSNRPGSLMALRSGNKCVLGYGAPAGHQFPSHNRQRALSSPATHLACRFSGRKRVFHHSLRICQGWKAALISPMLLKLHTLKVRL